MGVKIDINTTQIMSKIKAGAEAATIAVTEAVIEYGNIFVREDQGVLMASSLIGTSLTDTVNKSNWNEEDKKNYASAAGSKPKEGKAVWDTPYAKRVYYTGTPSKDKNPDASLQWVEKGVATYRKELDIIANKAAKKGF